MAFILGLLSLLSVMAIPYCVVRFVWGRFRKQDSRKVDLFAYGAVASTFLWMGSCAAWTNAIDPLKDVGGSGNGDQIVTSANLDSPKSSRRLQVSRDTFGENWPLTVREGELEALDGGYEFGDGSRNKAVIFHTGGKTYAVNGTAIGMKRFRDVREIWADDTRPEARGLGMKKNIGPLIDKGLAL